MFDLSIVIPCHNSHATLARCLTAIQGSSYDNYEIVVVDDNSSDNTSAVARQFTDKVIKLDENKGSGHARKKGIEQATSPIIVFIDSDIVIQSDTLITIKNFLDLHPEVDAITGLLSKEHPHKNFFSIYKNLYMNYIFNLLPERVTFLFGSICAIRKKSYVPGDNDLRHTPDTEFGQRLLLNKKIITFCRDLEVMHLKKYTAFSLIKNDFRVPCSWAKIFLRFGGWQQLGKNKTGFAHAPKGQLVSMTIAFPLLFLMAAGHLFPMVNVFLWILLIIWFNLNIGFFLFLLKERGILFSLAGILITFIDQLVMASGTFCGFISEMAAPLKGAITTRPIPAHVVSPSGSMTESGKNIF